MNSSGSKVPSFSRVDSQNLSSMLGRVVLIWLMNFFCVLSHTFLCLSKEKYAKERTPRGGGSSFVARSRAQPVPDVRRTPLSCGVCGAAVIHDGL